MIHTDQENKTNITDANATKPDEWDKGALLEIEDLETENPEKESRKRKEMQGLQLNPKERRCKGWSYTLRLFQKFGN